MSDLMSASEPRIYKGADAAALLNEMPPRIGDLVRRWADKTPDSRALFCGDKVLSYQVLSETIERAKALLREQGVRPGDRVMIVAENSIAAVIFLIAAMDCDAWACPINARMSKREVDGCREFSDCRVSVFTTADSAASADHAAGHDVTIYRDDVFGEVAIGAKREGAVPEPVSADKAEQPAVLLFSSGTTGDPKGIVLSHQAIMYMGGNMAQLRGLTPADTFYNVTPISHVMGIGAMLTAAFWAGASTELVPQFKPEHFVDALAEGRVTYIMAVPTVFSRILDYARTSGRSLRSERLRYIAAGGMPLDVTLAKDCEQAFGLPVSNSYGMSEISPMTRSRVGGSNDVSVGQVQPGISLRLVKEDGSDAAPGEAGEIWAQGPNLMLRYYRNPELTESVRRPGGFIVTGDIGVMDDTQSLTLVGRTKDVIIRSGFNVFPIEVEAVLSRYPGVALSAVVGRSVPGNEEIVAYVQPVVGKTLDVKELEDYARANLTPYKRPAEIRIVADLPIGPTGKILKSRLQKEV